MTRRRSFQLALAAGSMWMPLTHATDGVPDEAIPATGEEIPSLNLFDDWMRRFMTEHGVPGGQLAITRRGGVIYNRGFGLADRDAHLRVEPHSLFRIASISKAITAVAILRLAAAGKLRLDDPVVDILDVDNSRDRGHGPMPDERWRAITVVHCLMHTGGWDRKASYDPMFAYERVAKGLNMQLPVGPEEIIRYMRGQPLDHAPGEHFSYSNFGYCVLGRVIERLTGDGYEAFTQREVFAPLGITAPKIGRSLASQRAEHEVCYYTADDRTRTPVVGPDAGNVDRPVPASYGGWNQEALDAHGGWIASASDLVRFAAAFDDAALSGKDTLLSAEWVARMFTPHATVTPPDSARGEKGAHYCLGWRRFTPTEYTRPVRGHGGALPCTAATLVKLPDDINVAVLFNLGQNHAGAFLGGSLDKQVCALAARSSLGGPGTPQAGS